MGKFGITYRETYEGYYEVGGNEINTKQEAEEELRRMLMDGLVKGPDVCRVSSFETKELTTDSQKTDPPKVYILICTADGEISTKPYRHLKEARMAMRDAYQEATPSEWDDAYEDLSYISDHSAVLYANGDIVYAWSIEEVVFPKE